MDIDTEARYRITMLERKVNFLIKHFGLEAELENAAPEGFEDVAALVKRGDKIGAIKLYREKTGADLASAKKAVEEM
jgi:ribosomal protein L7/L12